MCASMKRPEMNANIKRFQPKITATCGFDESYISEESNQTDESNLLGIKCGIFSYTGGFILGGNEIVR